MTAVAGGQAVGISVSREARGRVAGDGVSLAYGYWPGSGRAVVGIHGLTASFMNFAGIADRLGGRRPLLAFDLRGRGESDKPEGHYGVEQHAADVAVAMARFGAGPSVVIGHSMGAYVAAALAARHPELVAGVILLDGGYLLDPPPGVEVEALLDTLLAPQVARLRQSYASRPAYFEFWRALPTFGPDEWTPWVEAYLDYDLGGEEPDLRPRALEAAVRADFVDLADRPAAEARLRALRCPAMAVRAEHGVAAGQPPLIPDAVLSGMAACVPDLEHHFLPGTTHYTIALADPGASTVAGLVVDFAQRCGA